MIYSPSGVMIEIIGNCGIHNAEVARTASGKKLMGRRHLAWVRYSDGTVGYMFTEEMASWGGLEVIGRAYARAPMITLPAPELRRAIQAACSVQWAYAAR